MTMHAPTKFLMDAKLPKWFHHQMTIPKNLSIDKSDGCRHTPITIPN